MENVKKFYEAMQNDEAIKEKAAKLTEKFGDTQPDEATLNTELLAFAKAEGYDFTEDELKAYSEELKSEAIKVIDDEELDAVAGGATLNINLAYKCWDTCFCVLGGGGTHGNPEITCACVVAGTGANCNPCPVGRKLDCFLGGGVG